MASFRWLLVLFMLALGTLPAPAAELTYPPGSRIGLAPPAGLVPSKTFFGYEDLNNSVAIMMVALPPQAYADLDASVTADALKRQGVTMESREALPLPSGKAFLVVGRQEVDNTKIRKWILVASSPSADRVRHRAECRKRPPRSIPTRRSAHRWPRWRFAPRFRSTSSSGCCRSRWVNSPAFGSQA